MNTDGCVHSCGWMCAATRWANDCSTKCVAKARMTRVTTRSEFRQLLELALRPLFVKTLVQKSWSGASLAKFLAVTFLVANLSRRFAWRGGRRAQLWFCLGGGLAVELQTWLILPVVICLSQRLSHACLSFNFCTVKLRKAHYNTCNVIGDHFLHG